MLQAAGAMWSTASVLAKTGGGGVRRSPGPAGQVRYPAQLREVTTLNEAAIIPKGRPLARCLFQAAIDKVGRTWALSPISAYCSHVPAFPICTSQQGIRAFGGVRECFTSSCVR